MIYAAQNRETLLSGFNNAELQLNIFTVNIANAVNKVVYTNYTGNWYVVLSI
jgi:hypothetical protein